MLVNADIHRKLVLLALGLAGGALAYLTTRPKHAGHRHVFEITGDWVVRCTRGGAWAFCKCGAVSIVGDGVTRKVGDGPQRD